MKKSLKIIIKELRNIKKELIEKLIEFFKEIISKIEDIIFIIKNEFFLFLKKIELSYFALSYILDKPFIFIIKILELIKLLPSIYKSL